MFSEKKLIYKDGSKTRKQTQDKTSCNFSARADAEEKKHADKHAPTPHAFYLQTRPRNPRSPAKHQHAKTQTKNLKTHTFNSTRPGISNRELKDFSGGCGNGGCGYISNRELKETKRRHIGIGCAKRRHLQ
jgi:hypothetical protein